VSRQIGVRDFKYVGKIFPVRTVNVIRCMRSGYKSIVSGGLLQMSQLVSQERIGVESSNLVEGLTRQQQQRCNLATDILYQLQTL